MQISIIIPIYKVAPYIIRCLQSIAYQTFTNYEVILVDDASPDNSLEIAIRFLQKNAINFQKTIHTKNKKQGAARNSGVKLAKGDYIFFIDADDRLINKNALQLIYNEIIKDNYDFVTAKEQHIEKKETILVTTEQYTENDNSNETKILKNSEILKALSENDIAPVVWNKLIRKNFLLNNNIHFFENTYFEDIPYCFTLCYKAKKIAIINTTTYVYYFQENNNATTAILSDKKIINAVTMCNELLLYADKNKVYEKTSKLLIHKTIAISVLYILAHPSLVTNKEKWKETYTLFQKMYNQSFLQNCKKHLFFPSWLAYYVMEKKDTIKNTNFINQLYRYVFLAMNIYNLKGKKEVIKEIRQKIC